MPLLTEAFKMFARRFRFALHGFRLYKGSAVDICSQIVHDCWNGTYFQTSAGHFTSFYTRDFGFCVPALLGLGYDEQVRKTLAWALDCFERFGKITTCISPKGAPFDFPTIAPDSLAFLLFALLQAKGDLVQEKREFLNKEIHRYYVTCVDAGTGLPKPIHLSSLKDHAMRKQSCYDTVMFGWLSNTLKKLKLDNPFAAHDYPQLLKKYYWKRAHFVDDLSGAEYVAGDANVFPFWTGVVTDKTMFRLSLAAIEREGLNEPFPLKYTSFHPPHKHIFGSWLSPNYEGTTIWAHLGMLYIDVVRRTDRNRAKSHLKAYTELIEQHRTFLELYNPDGTVYQTPFYVADEGMLWAAVYLQLHKNLNQ